MSETPADIRETAQSLYASLHANCREAGCDDWEKREDVEAIARAILAERQRCADRWVAVHGFDKHGVAAFILQGPADTQGSTP